MSQVDTFERVVAIIPAFNEEKTVAKVVAAALQLKIGAVFVVDDYSSDNTAKIAANAGAEVLALMENIGAWGAIQTGLRLASHRGFQIAITMDADGQHPPASVPAMLEPILSGSTNTVVGSCTERGTRSRHLAWRWLRMLTGLQVADLTSGMRAYDAKSIEVLASESASYLDYQDVGPLLLLNKNALSISEVPVPMTARTEGSSKIFHGWMNVAYYFLYSTILGISRRPARSSSSGNHLGANTKDSEAHNL